MLDLIRDLSNAYGTSGFEEEVLKVIKEYSQDLHMEIDKFMNCYLSNKKPSGKPTTLMLDAHLDEVGFMVQFIDEKGLIEFLPLGNWQPENLPSQRMMVRNDQGQYLQGVVSSIPPHFVDEDQMQEKISMKSLKIDLGASSRQEVVQQLKVKVGAPIVPFSQFQFYEQSGIMLGKAFDNRLGCAAVIETLKSLQDEDLDINVVGALAAQEEVGMRGAAITSRRLRPDLAIVFEGSPSDDTFLDQFHAQCVLGKGPQFRHMDRSYVSNPRFIALGEKIAKKFKLPFQNTVRSGGSTNAGRIHLSGQGVPTLVLGIPVRYIHTQNCYARLDDFRNTVKLAVEIIKGLDGEAFKIL